MNYHQQLKHANWLRKRFQILERDNYRCRICGSENEVEVHHLYYIPGAMIWDLDNEALVSVCHEHHELFNKELPKLAGLIALEILTGWDVVSDYKIFNTSTDE